MSAQKDQRSIQVEDTAHEDAKWWWLFRQLWDMEKGEGARLAYMIQAYLCKCAQNQDGTASRMR